MHLLQCISKDQALRPLDPQLHHAHSNSDVLHSWYIKALVSRLVCLGMAACSLVLHGMNSLTTNRKLVATCASTYTTHYKPCPVHIEAHIQVLLCDQCSDEAMPVCTTCVAYGVVAYLYKHMFNCRHIGPSCQAQLRDTPMSRPWYIDFFHSRASRVRRSTPGVAKQLILPERATEALRACSLLGAEDHHRLAGLQWLALVAAQVLEELRGSTCRACSREGWLGHRRCQSLLGNCTGQSQGEERADTS